jgi:hypothetical protein
MRLFGGNAQPVAHIGIWHVAKAPGGVKCQIDRIEFDMGNGMQHGRLPQRRAGTTSRHLGGMHQFRPWRMPGHRQARQGASSRCRTGLPCGMNGPAAASLAVTSQLHSAASICGYKEEGFIMVQHSNGLHRNRAIRHPIACQ